MNRPDRSVAVRWGLGRILLLLLLLGTGTVPGVPLTEVAAAGSGHAVMAPDIRVLETTADSITLMVEMPVPQPQPDSDDLGPCVRFDMPGHTALDRPWQPALPATGVWLGIPTEGQVTVRIVGQSWELLDNTGHPCRVTPPHVESLSVPDELLPAWTPPESAPEDKGWFPEAPAELKGTGFVRSQRVARLAFYPLQYEAYTGRLRYIQHMTVELRFPTTGLLQGGRPEPQQPEGGSFESFLADLLVNYEEARAWRVERPPQPADLSATVAATSSAPRYRVIIKESGVYTLPYATLAAADPTVDLTSVPTAALRMSNRGRETAIEVMGDSDGVLGPGDAILFYGESIASKYTDENVYWLTWDTPPGERMQTRDGTPTGGIPEPTWYTEILHLEVNKIYYPVTASGDTDHWYWDYLRKVPGGSPVSAAHSFELSAVATVPVSPTVRGVLRGYLASPSHHTDVTLNGHTIYSAIYPPGSAQPFTTTVPLTALLEGSNELSVTVGSGMNYDYTLTNWFEIQYPRRFIAAGDRLAFAGDAGPWTYVISGFLTDTVDILDVTDPWQPVRISHAAISGASGTYTVTFTHPLSSTHRYLLSTSDQRLAPLAVERAEPADLRAMPEGADYIIITHRDFYTAAQTLAAYHAARGLRVLTVDVQDVYDVFNEGIVDPEAIRSFLAYAYAHYPPPAPSYVLLVGDGNYDPLDYKGRGEPSFIPPYLGDVDPWLGETAADNRYVCVSGDDTLPDMHLGRLPVKTGAEAEALVAKIIAYADASLSQADWKGRLLFVADNEDDAGDFPAFSDEVADHYVPAGYTVQKIYYGTDPYTETVNTRRAITETINSGALLINYTGHGATEYWASEKLLARSYLPGLTNEGKLPLMVPMTCWEGYYIKPSPSTRDYSAMAEAIVRLPTTGAIASWSATGLGLAHGHDYLNRALFEALFWKDITALGPATTYAKLYLASHTAGYDDLLDTYLLFGDPATRLSLRPLLMYLPLIMRNTP